MSLVDALRPLAEFFARHGIPWHIGGSVASSVHGSPRATNDIDLVVDLRHEHVAELRRALGSDYYAAEELLHEAIRHHSCANVIHLDSGFKVDLFVKRVGPYDDVCLHRHVERQLAPGSMTFPVATAEDILLRKLQWFRDGGEQSDRQWSDVLGLLRLQRDRLDRTYLQRWASELGLGDLLARAELGAGDGA
ncbi:MAG: hypothetical protein MUC36_21185 [Planctomycetes bacterium]|jgi:hypothetical protein|nr:hypothetical protein [Planctomycetota bacterium]